ncbi:peptidyl-prolyl cis-trans isomerase SurA [Altererythrobacter atlanticus]|uniref:peptidylprolyl isomerase n=1 Tax=Croceibacterium atlanticum TaxID=1267766 RepID=UPI001795D45C|nr:peptidylprolyl isomerase [Croceibacterium atlanticum]MBB5734016.1 peptidyl-prolyl cis-trans isomerase SurA [Croceibacterium atlanticum]
MIDLAKTIGKFATATALAGLCASAAFGQQEAGQIMASDALNIPEDISLLQPGDPNSRSATATVNGQIITRTDVEQRVALILAANETESVPEDELNRLRMQVFRNLIDETIQIQEAAAQEMPVSRDEVDQTYNRLATQRFGRTPEEMATYLQSIGSAPQSLKRQIEGELAWNRLLSRNVAPFVNVSTEEVNELMERLKASKGTAEYRIGEIYLSATPTTRAQVSANAQQIVDQLKQGGSFVAYARQYSESSTASAGGDLGWIRLEQLQNPQLESVVRGLQPGQLAGPIEIPGGFDILYLIDKRQIGMADPRDAIVSLKQISIEFPKGTTQQAASERANEFAAAMEQITSCGQAESAAQPFNADVVSNEGLAIRALPEALQTMLLDLDVGRTTPPFGSLDEGVRVLLLCGREAAQADAGPNFDELMAQLEDDRVNKRAQRYLRDLRRDAVIEYK